MCVYVCDLCVCCVMCRAQAVHKVEECRLKPVNCKYCNMLVPGVQKKEHEDYCGNRSIDCDLCSEKIPRRGTLCMSECVRLCVCVCVCVCVCEVGRGSAANILTIHNFFLGYVWVTWVTPFVVQGWTFICPPSTVSTHVSINKGVGRRRGMFRWACPHACKSVCT